MAQADAEASPAALFTYSCEMRCSTRMEQQRIITVLLPFQGLPTEMTEPKRWLKFGDTDRALVAADVWQRWFAHWVPGRRPEADAVAKAAMQRDGGLFVAEHRIWLEREACDLQHWLHARADDICGVHEPPTGDLFDAPPSGPEWRSLSAPLERLAAYAAGGSNPPARRREADSAVELFQRRDKERTARAALSSPRLRPIGMLMLVPPGAGA